MIDIHCHILPSLDDGPDSLEGSLAMARRHVERGVELVVATPHVNERFPLDSKLIAERVTEFKKELEAEQIPLRVVRGAEVALTSAMELDDEELSSLTLAGGPWLLLEPPLTAVGAGVEASILEIQRRGVKVVLAHPERCAAFIRDPAMLDRLVEAGCLSQLTASSLQGDFGRRVRDLSIDFASRGVCQVVASDAHDSEHRAPGLYEPMADAGFTPLANWLGKLVPAAILTGSELPSRPGFVGPDQQGGIVRRLFRGRS